MQSAIWAIAIFLAVSVSLPADPPADQPKVRPAQGETNPTSELVKLLQGHTDPAVIQAFLKNWSVPYLTSADNLLELQKAGANEAVLDAFAKRGAELRLRQSLEHPESRQSVIILPSAQSAGSGLAPLVNWAPPYPFSDALYLWANWYPLPYFSPGYGYGFWSYPRRFH